MKRGICVLLFMMMFSGCSSKNNNDYISDEEINNTKVMSFDEGKTYDQDVTYKDDMEVTKDGVIIENATFENDLTITSKVGDGKVVLRNVEVNGDLIINGGSIISVELINSIINKINVDRKEEKVRLYLDINSSVQLIEVNNPAIIDIDGQVKELIANYASDIPTGKSSVIELINLYDETSLNIFGDVNELNIFENAKNSEVIIELNSKIKSLKIEPFVYLNGNGNIEELFLREDIKTAELII